MPSVSRHLHVFLKWCDFFVLIHQEHHSKDTGKGTRGDCTLLVCLWLTKDDNGNGFSVRKSQTSSNIINPSLMYTYVHISIMLMSWSGIFSFIWIEHKTTKKTLFVFWIIIWLAIDKNTFLKTIAVFIWQ
jgi:hypothetical protein